MKDVVTFRKAFIGLENLTNEKLKKQSTNEYPQVTKKKLMQKKTMLNQNEHFDSRILPFYYALNISIDDLKNEIRDIKDMFNRV